MVFALALVAQNDTLSYDYKVYDSEFGRIA